MIATFSTILSLDGTAAEPDITDQDRDRIGELIRIALFSDARARDDDPHDGDRRGFWADALDGSVTGSRLWLLERGKIDAVALERCRAFAEEALAFLVEEGIATGVAVRAERIDQVSMGLTVEVTRDELAGRTLRHAELWSTYRAA